MTEIPIHVFRAFVSSSEQWTSYSLQGRKRFNLHGSASISLLGIRRIPADPRCLRVGGNDVLGDDSALLSYNHFIDTATWRRINFVVRKSQPEQDLRKPRLTQ